MKLRGTGRNVALKQKDFQCLSLKAISDFAVPSRQLQEAPVALLCDCDVWEWISPRSAFEICVNSVPTENYSSILLSLASHFVTLEKPPDAIYTFLEFAFLQNPVP